MEDFNREVFVKKVADVFKDLEDVLSSAERKDINRRVGINVREHIADHLAKASVPRHKCADRLGAPHSGFLEFSVARGMMIGKSKYKGDGPQPETRVDNVTETDVTVTIANTPGLTRAYHPLTITPRKAKWLTIPIHRDAYQKRARDFGDTLTFIPSRRKGKAYLARKTGDSKKQTLRPLYVLVKKSVIPQDRLLLPSDLKIAKWAVESVEASLEFMGD